jgi:hypothetical protein
MMGKLAAVANMLLLLVVLLPVRPGEVEVVHRNRPWTNIGRAICGAATTTTTATPPHLIISRVLKVHSSVPSSIDRDRHSQHPQAARLRPVDMGL